MSETYPVRRWKTLSSDLNKSVGANSFYSGSIAEISGYKTIRVLGEFSGSASLGVTNFLFLSISHDGSRFNPWYRSGSIPSGSSPTSIVVDAPANYVRGVLQNQSGSSVSGSVVLQGFFES